MVRRQDRREEMSQHRTVAFDRFLDGRVWSLAGRNCHVNWWREVAAGDG